MSTRPTVLCVLGTRPEAIKMAPVIQALAHLESGFQPLVCSTGQHREMLDQVLRLFAIVPDYDLALMKPDQALAGLTARLLKGLDTLIEKTTPAWIVAQGDTTTVLAASLVAYYRNVPFAHVEAGLRTGRPRSPFPEEMNRRIADLLAVRYFAPTTRNRDTLLAEGVPANRIRVTGNTVIDALQYVRYLPYEWDRGPLACIDPKAPMVTVTAHRRESFGAPFREICTALTECAHTFPDVQFVYPVHLNPQVQAPVREMLGTIANVHLVAPLDYHSLVTLMDRSRLILTDSGGIQEEAPSLGVPVIVMRKTTERPEALTTGLVTLTGTDRAAILSQTVKVLKGSTRKPAQAFPNPFGDGTAARKIVQFLKEPVPVE